jgi:hypothetical protein
MTFLKTSHEGCLMIDHRASPGLSDDEVRGLGLPAGAGRGLWEAPTLGCPHCGWVVVLNPDRKRERAHCYICDRYICDGCDAIRHESGYVHTTTAEVVEKVKSGRFVLVGSIARGKLIPIAEFSDG